MPAAIPLPAPLTRQFDLLERRLWRMDALVAGTGGLGSLLLAYTLLFASDRLWDTPAWLRCLLAVCGWSGFAFFSWRYGSRWIWGRRSIRALAVIVQKRYRRLGDRLLGIVELADPGARPSNFSPELCAAAIAQVAGEASAFDFEQAAGERQPRRYLFAFLALAALVALLAMLAPEASWNALERWFWPAAAIERYTFVSIEELPDHLVVAQGEPFEVAVGLAPHSYWRPLTASAHFEGLPASGVALHNGVATFHLPGQTQRRVLWMSIGDVTRPMEIDPAVRPDLRALRARLTLPAYLEYPPQDQRIDGGALSFLPGTSAVFTGEAVRDLASARLEGDAPAALSVHGPQFTTRPLLLELERNITFTWRDTLGLAAPAPMTIHAAPVEDAPPQVNLRGLAAAIAMLPEETAPIDLAASDDYGVRRVALAWQRAAASPEDAPGPLHEIELAGGQPQARTLGGHYDFSPALLDIAPDTTILVRGLAVDYYPDRQPSSSSIYLIHVLSRETHAQLIHDEFEKLLEQLEEIARRQEALMQAGQAVRLQKPEALSSDQSAQKLGQQATGQQETAGQLKQLARQTADTLAEALRNPLISPATLKDWAAHAEQMNALAGNAMPAAAQSLEASQADSSQRAQKLDQALAQEKSILDAMRRMEREADTNLETLMAQTLAARLRRAAGAERDIAGNFQKMLPDTIGMTPAQLPDAARQALDSMTTQHAGVVREAGRLEDEISRLYDRTSLTRYGAVAHEMDADKTTDALTNLGSLVGKNIGVQSIATTRAWADQFEKWAQLLGASDQSKSPPGGSGSQSAAQMQALLALMRLRQQQDQLREQTAVLEEQKQTSDDYRGGAQAAARQQGSLRDAVQALPQEYPLPPAQLAPVDQSMGDAAGLLGKPETGKPTYNAQTDAINLLDSVITQQAKNAGANTAALMAMMGMGMGGRGTGSTAGGAAGNPDVAIPGTREGRAPDQRSVLQAAGIDNSQLPGEFRDAIEGYHHAIEQSSQP